LGFFLRLKNEVRPRLGVLVLPLRLGLSVSVQGLFKEALSVKFSISPPTSVEPEAYDLGDNANIINGGEKCSNIQ
jgi:hypothetical protein